MREIRRPTGAPEQFGIAGAAGDLHRDLVGPKTPDSPVQGQPGAAEPVVAHVGPERERVFRLGERVQMPTVQLAELLAELADVEAQVAGEPGPVGVTLLDADVPVLEAHEDLRVRVGIERRLEPNLELAGLEIVVLDAGLLAVPTYVARDADLRIELRLVSLPAYELDPARSIGPGGRVATADGGGRSRAQRRQVLARVSGRRGWPRGRDALEGGAQAVETRLERSHLRGQRIHLALHGLLRCARARDGKQHNGERGDITRSDHPQSPLVALAVRGTGPA